MGYEWQDLYQSCRLFSEHRRVCTGQQLDLSPIQAWQQPSRTKADFTALLLAMSTVWKETWKVDVGFFFGLRAADVPARDFQDLLYHLRTATAHADNPAATARWDEWTREVCNGRVPQDHADWSACDRALLAVMHGAVAFLGRLAATGKRQQSFRRLWQAKISESVEAVVVSVAADLNIQLRSSQRDQHVREVTRRWSNYRLRNHETPAVVIASFAERSLASWPDSLPCDYRTVLDELGVIGTSDALAALRLAHVIAEVSRSRGDDFLKLVASTWTALRPESPRRVAPGPRRPVAPPEQTG